MSDVDNKSRTDRVIAEFEARLAAAKHEPPGLARDCKIADLESRIAATQSLADAINDIDRLEARHGPVPLGPEKAEQFFDYVNRLRNRPKPN